MPPPGDVRSISAGAALAKSNWAQKLDTPPYYAYPVTGGITFSFGGVKVSDHAQVIGTDWEPIPGLFACGEMVGGLFHNNYPGGSGLMSGAGFGRTAGRRARGDLTEHRQHSQAIELTAPMKQLKLRAVFMRGGTSKAVMFRAADLP